MNFKILMILSDTLLKLMAAAADGQITVDEVWPILVSIASAFGVDLTKDDLWGFEAKDGSIYLKINKSLLDKLSLKVNLE